MTSMNTVPAIILAAGASKRMGRPKALLKIGRKTLIEDQIARFKKAGCKPIIVVFNPKGDCFVEHSILLSARLAMTRIVINRDWRLGQFSSLKSGLKSLKNYSNGCLILPVDVPFVPISVTKKIIKTITPKTEAIIPFHGHDKKMGHPIWLSKKFIKRILRTRTKTGRLDKMFKQFKRVQTVQVDSPTVLNNINTPKQWKEILMSVSHS